MQAAAARAAAKAALSAKARARQKRMEAAEKLDTSSKRYLYHKQSQEDRRAQRQKSFCVVTLAVQ